MAMKDWSLSIKLFSIILRTLIWKVIFYVSAEVQSANWAGKFVWNQTKNNSFNTTDKQTFGEL